MFLDVCVFLDIYVHIYIKQQRKRGHEFERTRGVYERGWREESEWGMCVSALSI